MISSRDGLTCLKSILNGDEIDVIEDDEIEFIDL